VIFASWYCEKSPPNGRLYCTNDTLGVDILSTLDLQQKKIKQTSPWQMRQQQEQAEELQKPQNEERGALIRANILRALKDHYGDWLAITLKDNRKHQER